MAQTTWVTVRAMPNVTFVFACDQSGRKQQSTGSWERQGWKSIWSGVHLKPCLAGCIKYSWGLVCLLNAEDMAAHHSTRPECFRLLDWSGPVWSGARDGERFQSEQFTQEPVQMWEISTMSTLMLLLLLLRPTMVPPVLTTALPSLSLFFLITFQFWNRGV